MLLGGENRLAWHVSGRWHVTKLFPDLLFFRPSLLLAIVEYEQNDEYDYEDD